MVICRTAIGDVRGGMKKGSYSQCALQGDCHFRIRKTILHGKVLRD